jgi:hypothetical protein
MSWTKTLEQVMIEMIVSRPTFVRIPYNDPRYMMTDGIMQVQVAGIQMTDDCPAAYRKVIAEAMYKGWLVPFAMIKQELDYCI